jgi:hypothetical protein
MDNRPRRTPGGALADSCTRRTAMQWLAAPLLAPVVWPAVRASSQVLAITVVESAGLTAALRNGVVFGAEEAGRTAELLGVVLGLEFVGAAAERGVRAGAGPAAILVAGTPVLPPMGAEPTAPVLVQLVPEGCASRAQPGALSVAARFERRLQALADWSLQAGLQRWLIAARQSMCGPDRLDSAAARLEALGIDIVAFERDPVRAEPLLEQAGKARAAAVCLLEPAEALPDLRRRLANASPRLPVIGTTGPGDEQEGCLPGEAWVAEWHASLSRFGARELNERFHRRFHRGMESGAWLGWIAVRAATDAALRSGGDVRRGLGRVRLDGHKGTALVFDEDGFLGQPLLVIGREDSGPVRVLHEHRE